MLTRVVPWSVNIPYGGGTCWDNNR